MAFRPTIIERAYELAASGQYQTVTEVKLQLDREGFVRVGDHLRGRTMMDALRKLLVEARGRVDGQDAPA